MADDDTSTDETVETRKVDAEPATPAEPVAVASASTTTRRELDRRSIGYGALAVGALVLAFFAGMVVGNHHDRDGRFERSRGEFAQGGPGGGGRGMFERGGRGDDMPGGGMQGGMRGGMQGGMPGGGPGEHGGMGRGGHGGAGVVESVSSDELTVAPLGGRIEELTVKLGDDTEVKQRGDDGAGDVEDAKVSDIDEGDIVMVLGAPGDSEADADDEDATSATVDAKVVVILRDGDE